MEKKTIEKCGCEFTTISSKYGSCCFLSKCRCQKHYNEQFKATIDGVTEHYTPSNIIPLEAQKCKQN